VRMGILWPLHCKLSRTTHRRKYKGSAPVWRGETRWGVFCSESYTMGKQVQVQMAPAFQQGMLQDPSRRLGRLANKGERKELFRGPPRTRRRGSGPPRTPAAGVIPICNRPWVQQGLANSRRRLQKMGKIWIPRKKEAHMNEAVL